MATVKTKLVTAKEFAEWVDRPENRGKFFELEHGEIIEMPPPGKYHGFVCGNSTGILPNFAAQRRRGYVCSNDTGLLVESDPDTVRGADVSFYEDSQTPETMERSFALEPPRLVLEILSPHDRIGRLTMRIRQFLERGVALVWVLDPEDRTVTVWREGRLPHVVGGNEELTGEDVLPDFRCSVAEFFAMPGQPAPGHS
jgi:Uma2 family endonuclease